MAGLNGVAWGCSACSAAKSARPHNSGIRRSGVYWFFILWVVVLGLGGFGDLEGLGVWGVEGFWGLGV